MSPEREIRPTVNGTDSELVGSSTTPSVSPSDAKPSEPVALIGSRVEKALHDALSRLRSGAIGLDDLTPSLSSFWLDGHAAALASIIPALTEAEQQRDREKADADRLYGYLYNNREPVKVGPSYRSLQETRRQTYYGGTE